MYLSAEKIAAMEGVRRVHNLNPAAIRIDKSLGDEVGLKNIGIHLISIAPGDKSTELHTHRYEEEAIYILSGRGTEVIGDQTYKISPGDFIGFLGGHATNKTINDGTRTAGLSRHRPKTRAGCCRLPTQRQASLSQQRRAKSRRSRAHCEGLIQFETLNDQNISGTIKSSGAEIVKFPRHV